MVRLRGLWRRVPVAISRAQVLYARSGGIDVSSTDESGLPEDFETFADTRICSNCSDRVDPEHYVKAHDLCAGCYWGDRL